MKLGAEPKKVVLLGVLALVGGIVLYYNVFSGGSDTSGFAPRPTAIVAQPGAATGTVSSSSQSQRRRMANRSPNLEFKPRIGSARPEDRPDPATIDPTLRLNLLAKIQNVQPEAASRNLFQFEEPKPAAQQVQLPKNVPKIPVNSPQGPPKPAAPSGPPPPPPMTFKYYGFKVSKLDGRKEAFLLDGDDIIIAGENDTFKRRYKIVRIGVNSIVIEDTQFKNTQTLQLQEEAVA